MAIYKSFNKFTWWALKRVWLRKTLGRILCWFPFWRFKWIPIYNEPGIKRFQTRHISCGRPFLVLPACLCIYNLSRLSTLWSRWDGDITCSDSESYPSQPLDISKSWRTRSWGGSYLTDFPQAPAAELHRKRGKSKIPAIRRRLHIPRGSTCMLWWSRFNGVSRTTN